MNKNFITEHILWPTPCYITFLKFLNNENLLNYIYNIKEKQITREKSNAGGWQSNLLDIQDNNLIPLISSIKEICLSLPFGFKKISVNQIWANINKKNNYNKIHSHGGEYVLSGTYYVKIPKDSGRIVFRDPRPGAILNTNFNINYCNGEFKYFEPKDSMLILFPSFLDHFVEPSNSENDRISISFDVVC